MNGERLDELDPPDRDVLAEVARWTVDYLCQWHPDLGRTGDVCPYTEVSMREDLLLAADPARRDHVRRRLQDATRLWGP